MASPNGKTSLDKGKIKILLLEGVHSSGLDAFRRDEDLRLDPDLDYAAIGGLSTEVRLKLAAAKPVTLGQAGRIEGVTPGALTALLAHVKRADRKRA